MRSSSFAWGLTSTGVTAFIVRGVWGAGRMGKAMLPSYKKSLSEDGALFELFDTVFGLVAIGRRSSRLRPEIAKALEGAQDRATTPGAAKLRRSVKLGPVFRAAIEFIEVDDAEIESALLRVGNQMIGDALDGAPEEERNAIARALPLNTYADGMTDGKSLLTSLNLIAATARGQPEQFYYPREVLEAVHKPWKPEHTRHILEPVRYAEHMTRPEVPVRTHPGSNDPCSCGSGRKYKKCCGRPGGSVDHG